MSLVWVKIPRVGIATVIYLFWVIRGDLIGTESYILEFTYVDDVKRIVR